MVSTLLWAVLKGGDNLTIANPGLPNITGMIYRIRTHQPISSDNCIGAFSRPYSYGNILPAANGNVDEVMDAYFDASWSNPIYGASSTVQPPALQLIAQIRY